MNEPNKIEQYLLDVAQRYEQGDYHGALSALSRAEEILKNDGRAWQLCGLAHFALGDLAEGIAAFEQATSLVPLCPEAQCRLAECYLRVRKRELAMVIFQHLATLKTLPQELVQDIAVGLSRVGEHQASLDYSKAQWERFPQSHVLLSTAASMMRRLGADVDASLSLSHQAHQLQPKNVAYRISLAYDLITAGRLQEALRLLTAVDLDEVQCIASLQYLKTLFTKLDNEHWQQECQARLEQIGYELSMTYRPPKKGR